ncbi:hypothetical protein [Shewanella sp.]|jgi:hypothetical protein|uniref:hypothetical protein n=1 Tax=Shewanella sp. TaxID=50422 RepID=UPI00356429AA
MPKYTVQDTTSGKTVTFEWNGQGSPTESDMEEVFQGAGLREQTSQPTPKTPYKFGESAVKSMSQPSPFFKGGKQITQGNVPAGLANVITGMAQAPFIPVSGAMEEARNIPYVGNPLVNLISSPVNALGQLADLAGRGIQKGLDYVGVPKNVQNLGMSPGNAQEASQAVGDLTKTGLSYTTPKIISSAAKNLPTGEIFRTTAKKLGTKSITPPFDPKKGLETFDRPVQTSLEGNYPPSRKGVAKLQEDLKTTHNQAKSIASNLAKKGQKIDFKETNKLLDEQISNADRASAYYDETVAAVEDARARLNRVAEKYTGGQVPLDVAYELKSSFEKLANGKYDQSVAPSQVHIDLYKKVGGKLLDQITQDVPQLRKLGLKQRDLIELEPILGRKISASEKAGIINWQNMRKAGIAGVAGAASGSPALGLLTFGAEEMLSNPRAVHSLAMLSQRMGNKFPQYIRDNPNMLPPRSYPYSMETPKDATSTISSQPQNVPQSYTRGQVARATNRTQPPPTIPPEIQYIGMRDMGGGVKVPMFQDAKTGSFFVVQSGETFQQALTRSRSKFQ